MVDLQDQMRTSDADITMATGRLIKAFIIESQPLVADALTALLSQQADMIVLGSAGWATDSAAQVAELKPDVVIIDIRSNTDEAIDAADAIGRTGCQARLIVFARDASDVVVLTAIELGASAVVYESRDAAEMIRVVREVAGGANVIAPKTVATILKKRQARHDLNGRLTNPMTLLAH